jgi:nucleoside-diphosphate-sugar epimerase
VVVTGGLGFVGAHVCRELHARGYEVVSVDDLRGSYSPGAGPHARAALSELGIACLDADARHVRLDGAHALVHLAGLPGVRAAWSSAALRRENAALPAALARSAHAAGVRMVHASTSSVYGDAAVLPTPEHAPLGPLNPYARSKLAGERAVLREADAGADALVVRMFTVFGPGQRPDMALAAWTSRIAAGEPIRWCAPPGAVRELSYVGDVARGIALALERGRSGQSYNLPGCGPVPVRRALEALEAALGRHAVVERVSSPVREARATAACGRKALAELGYRPRVGLEEGIARQITARHAGAAPALAA